MKTQLLLSAFLFSAFIMQAQYQEQSKIVPPDGKRRDWYGNTIAFSGNGNTMIAGAIYHDVDSVINSGAAYIYHRNGSQWVFDAEISPAIKIVNAGFGYALALSGDGSTAVIGGLATSKYAYLFQKQNGAWIEKRRIQKPYTTGGTGFGSTTAISYNGKTIMIGDLYSAKVSIYEQGANGFKYVTTITDPRGYSEFGVDIALSSKGNTALIGAANDSGAVAYVYEKINNNWQQTAIINPKDTFAVAWNNLDLSLDGKTAILGADQNLATNQAYKPGPYIYRKTNQGWLQQAQLVATGTTYIDNPEGVAVSAKGDTASYAVPSKTVGTHEGQGELDVFTYTNNKWVQLQAIHYSNGKANDYFGSFGFAMTPDTRTVAGGCDEYGIPYGTGYVVTFENDNAFATGTSIAMIAKEEPVTSNKIIVAPNPVSSIFTLQIKTKLTGLLYIVNNKGVVVRTVNSNQLQQSIDVSGLQSGQYFIKAADISGHLISCSFIKE